MTDTDADTPPAGDGHDDGHLSDSGGHTGGQVTVTPGQLAAARGVSERTVRRWIAKGALPSGMVAEQTPDGWRITVPDARVIDCQTLNDVAGQEPDSADTALWDRIKALEAELERIRADLVRAQQDLSQARDREAWLRQRVEAAETARDRADAERVELVARIPPALPPAPEERDRRGWWAKLLGR